jgi:hypothetical protein
MQGSDWLGAGGELDLNKVATFQDNCRADLEKNFLEFSEAYQREDSDRLEQMIRSLEVHLERKKINFNNRFNAINATNDQKRIRILPALRGQLKKEEVKVEQKIAELSLKSKLLMANNSFYLNGEAVKFDDGSQNLLMKLADARFLSVQDISHASNLSDAFVVGMHDWYLAGFITFL